MSSLYLLEDAVYFAFQTSGAGSTIATNKYMIEKSDIVIAYVNREYGGAYKSYTLAKKKNKKVYNLY